MPDENKVTQIDVSVVRADKPVKGWLWTLSNKGENISLSAVIPEKQMGEILQMMRSVTDAERKIAELDGEDIIYECDAADGC